MRGICSHSSFFAREPRPFEPFSKAVCSWTAPVALMKNLLRVFGFAALFIQSVRAAAILAGPVYNPATTHSYFLLTSSPWTDAEALAVSMGGHLVTVNDAAENDWLLSTFSNFGGQPRALWTGLTDAAQEGVFVWSSGEQVSYTHWESGQPDDGAGFYPHEDYVLIWPSPGPRSPGYWNDYINTNTFTQFSLQVFGVVEVSGNYNNWTNPVSAKWESPSWSLGKLPATDQVVNIVNDGYKAVNIDGTTLRDFPSALTVGSLELSAPTNGLSTLLLNYFGQSTPFKVVNSCLIGTNGTLANLASGFEVDGTAGGALTIDGGTFTQQGGLTVVTPPVQVLNGNLNATNATMNLGPLQVGSGYPQLGTMNQSGGTILSSAVSIGRGSYSLLGSGTLYALGGTYLNDPEASFVQTGGSNYGDVFIHQGNYQMNGGLVQGTNLSTITLGSFVQQGGTVKVQNLSARGLGSDFSIFSSYALIAGTLGSATLNISNYGIFLETGGTLILTNRLNLFDSSGLGARFELEGGNALMPSLVVSNGGDYLQRSGTNVVSGDIALYNSAIAIYGGRLSAVNTGVGENARVWQQGGTHEVSGVLSITGTYALEEGSLSVDGIYTRGNFVINNLEGTPPVLNDTGLINFGGTLSVSVSQNTMGQLGLSANGTISLGNQPLVLRFADSSNLNWDPNSRLTIAGWNGSYSGNGSNQVYFGNTSNGLTLGQLSQIQFLDPAGSQPGQYKAQILSTGEVVPVATASAPALQGLRSGDKLVLTWTGNYQLLTATNVFGPYQLVSGGASPYTNDTNDMRTTSQRFFMLKVQ